MIIIKELLHAINKDYPQDAANILYLMIQLKEYLQIVIDKYSLETDKDIFIEELTKIIESIEEVEIETDNNYGQLAMDGLGHENIKLEDKLSPNYEDYKVDNTIEHSLLEDLTHIRPYGFSFIDDKLINARTWKDVFLKTCEILIKIDEEKFMNFENLTRMNGEVRDYFSRDSSNIIDPIKIINKIYITTSMSANGYSEFIVKMLKEYDCDIDKYKLFFFADYSPLNSEEI